MLKKILLGFSIVSNFATLIGFWVAYQTAPSALQEKIGHVLMLLGAIISIITYVAFAVFVMKPAVAHPNLAKELDALLAARGVTPDSFAKALPLPAAASTPVTEPLVGIDGEVYRIALAPRAMSWELLRDIFRLRGEPEEAKVDCDILVQIYLVNASKNESHYVRSLNLSAVVGGSLVSLDMKRDLRAMDIKDQKYEYGLEADDHLRDADSMPPLFLVLPYCLSPGQAIEGWARFMAENINPDRIDQTSWKLTVVDSRGTEYLITKSRAPREDRGIGLRRVFV